MCDVPECTDRMPPSTTCGAHWCKNMVVHKQTPYCADHQCRVKDCPRSKDRCEHHYCRPRYVSCGAPVKKKGDWCSKHMCPVCRVSRYDCRLHFCGLTTCLEKKEMDSMFCRHHTCPFCKEAWPCRPHVCEVTSCGHPVAPPLPFCSRHSLPSLGGMVMDGMFMKDHVKNLRYFWKENLDHTCITNYDKFIDTIRTHKMDKTFANVFRTMNATITPSDSRQYDLSCPNYCSEGYCSCDLIPRLSDDLFHQRIVSMADESVYRLSTKANTNDPGHEYMAWTIPTLFVDEFDTLSDGTETQIQSMIRFERITM